MSIAWRPERTVSRCWATSPSFFCEVLDLLPDHPAVGFELGFARAPETDTAADTRQVGPHPGQSRQHVLQLRQLDLELGFVAPGAGGEDVEDELGAVHHRAP